MRSSRSHPCKKMRSSLLHLDVSREDDDLFGLHVVVVVDGAGDVNDVNDGSGLYIGGLAMTTLVFSLDCTLTDALIRV